MPVFVDLMAIITVVVLVWIGAAALALALGRVAAQADAADELRRRGQLTT